MSKDLIDDNIRKQIELLSEKYEAMGQNLSSYLDGLLYSDYLTYWDYVHLDTLLSLQNPKTDFPDEKIFIIYHQITELYFKLIINELEQACLQGKKNVQLFARRLKRVNRYFDHLIDSFDVMIEGMDPDQFLKFRMSLLPASGFQSAQYRYIEIYCTDFYLLTRARDKQKIADHDIVTLYEKLYWRMGATELATGKKTLTLRHFEKKYRKQFVSRAKELRGITLRSRYHQFYEGNEEIVESLKLLDHQANVAWPLVHLRSAAHYLQKDKTVIAATGGTNWQKYLPPKNQHIQFYPELWSEEEIKEWGRRFEL